MEFFSVDKITDNYIFLDVVYADLRERRCNVQRWIISYSIADWTKWCQTLHGEGQTFK